MIDLTKKSLPNTVNVGGRDFSIYTDFRLWMRFSIAVTKMKKGDDIDISYLFKNDMPAYCDITELFVFSNPPCPVPRDIGGGSHEKIFDYEIDSDLIYAAFLGQYGIDLTEVEELHWHKFLALLKGLNDSTKLREVMGYRSYKKSKKTQEEILEDLKDAYSLDIESEYSDEELDAFNKAFGG